VLVSALHTNSLHLLYRPRLSDENGMPPLQPYGTRRGHPVAMPAMTTMVTTFALSAILAHRPVFAWRGKDHAMPDDT
jgi:hypothetical protein